MDDFIEYRVVEISKYIVENNITIREAAKIFKISKSLIHRDIHARLPLIDPILYYEVKGVLDFNFSIKHLNGGNASKINKLKERILKEGIINE